MGFFGLDDIAPPKPRGQHVKGVSIAAVREAGCALCPLNNTMCKSPKIKPLGSTKPLVYILGGSPSRQADREDAPFGKDIYRFIKSKIPDSYRDAVRWNNVVRTFVGDGDKLVSANRDHPGVYVLPKDPEQLAIEACRNYQEQDILKYRPQAVIAIGAVALRWIGDETHDYLWQGRRFPAKLGDHTFWVYPFQHPYHVLKDRRWDGHEPDGERTWRRHFRQVFKDLENDRNAVDIVIKPRVHTEEDARKNVSWVMGEGADDLRTIEKFLDRTCYMGGATGMDYETNKLRPYMADARILTAAVANKDATLAFPFDHREAKWTTKHRRMLGDMWGEFLVDKRITKVAHQLAFEMEWSAHRWGHDMCRAADWDDTISQAYVINERQGMLGLENLTRQYWGIDIKKLSDVNRRNMDAEPLSKILPYNGVDAKYHRALHLRQMPIIRALGLEAVYEHQLARVPSLVLTQLQGFPVDQEELREFAKKFLKEQRQALERLRGMECWETYQKAHGVEFNPGSTHDVKKMLKIIGINVASTNEKTLRTIEHPFASALIKWRKPTKILGTYVDGVTEGTEGSHVMPDGLVHCIISTYKVETWRTSSEDPNTQNWPKRGPNVVIRRAIRKDKLKVVAFDYAGIQARNIAMESGDPALVKAFFDWYDIHTEWAVDFATSFPKWAPKGWEDRDGEVWKELRNVSKNGFVFPSFFGAKPRSISVNVNVFGRKELRVEEVEEVQDRLFDKFPRVKKWQEGLKTSYEKHGYVTGHSGFRRHAPIEFNQLINSPIQADESIIVLSAMNALSELNYKRYQPIMEIHDDLTFLWPENKIEKRSEIVLREMLKVRFDWINTPLVVERSIGDNWCDLKKAGEYESVGRNDWREHRK